jgi:hypothetical protein
MMRRKSPPLSVDCMTCGAKMALKLPSSRGTIEPCTPTAAHRRISNSLLSPALTCPEWQAAGTSFVRVGLVGTRAADAVADSTIGRLVAG